jgi:hypothetical protein
MNFAPVASPGKWITLGLAITAWGLAWWLYRLLPGQTVSAQAFWLGLGLAASLISGVVLFYWAVAAFRLRYYLNRNGLLVDWALSRLTVPLPEIEAVLPGDDLSGSLTRFRGWLVPGLRAGRGQLAAIGRASFLTTASLHECIVVRTPRCAYVISPRERDDFIDAWRVRVPLGTTQDWPEAWQGRGPLRLPVWTDRVAWVLAGGGLLLFVALVGYVFHRYDALPQSLPVHFDAQGQADRIAPKSFILNLVAVGGLLLLFNFLLALYLHHRERLGAYFLWGLAGLVQAGLFIATRTMFGA